MLCVCREFVFKVGAQERMVSRVRVPWFRDISGGRFRYRGNLIPGSYRRVGYRQTGSDTRYRVPFIRNPCIYHSIRYPGNLIAGVLPDGRYGYLVLYGYSTRVYALDLCI